MLFDTSPFCIAGLPQEWRPAARQRRDQDLGPRGDGVGGVGGRCWQVLRVGGYVKILETPKIGWFHLEL